MSTFATDNQHAVKALLDHPSTATRVAGSALPHPVYDPAPQTTLALHQLWDALRPFIRLAPNGPALAPGLPDALRGFTAFGPLLASFQFLLLAFQTNQN